MSQPIPVDHPLRKLFRWAVDRAFEEHKDLYTPEVREHIAEEVLPDFVHVDRIYRLRDALGRRLERISEMLEVAYEKEGPERRLEVDRYIGDFVLFMGGFFPHSLRRDRWRVAEPMVSKVGGILVSFSQPFDYYVAEGRNAYRRAAETARLFDPAQHATYSRLGEQLDRYLDFLAYVKRFLHRDPHFRKVEDILD